MMNCGMPFGRIFYAELGLGVPRGEGGLARTEKGMLNYEC